MANQTSVIEANIDYKSFKAKIKESQKADLIDGEIKIESPATIQHEELFGFLYYLLRHFVAVKKLGKIFGSGTLVQIDDKNGSEPDILFVSKDRLHILQKFDLNEAPDMVVEIISKSSRTNDRVRKFIGYEKIGVKEYWLIDPERHVADFYRLVDDCFVEVDVESGIFRSEVVAGFWLRLDWLFISSTLNEIEIANEIVAGSE